MIQTLQMFGTI